MSMKRTTAVILTVIAVTLSDSAQVIGTFQLQRGSDGQLMRCL